MVRGTGKFKAKRGGGRSFSKNMTLGSDGLASGDDPRARRKAKHEEEAEAEEEEESEEDEEESEEEEDSEEEESEEEGKPELTRAQRKEMKKKQAQAKKAAKQPQDDDVNEEDEDLINPNHVQKKLTISDLNEPRQLTRREREQKEKKEAEEKHWKLHIQGKTDKAKSDLERLTKIRAEREAAAAKRQAETEAKAKEAQVKKEAQLNRRKT